jgi:uncharacterized RDD family membrane protein YckC
MNNPYTAPSTEIVQNEIDIDNLPMPSRWKRFFASLIDGGVSLILWIPVILHKVLILEKEWDAEMSFEYEAITYGISMVSFAIVNYYLLNRYAQTVGKYVMGIKISDIYYRKCGVTRILLIRTFPWWILGYWPLGGFLWCCSLLMIYRKDRRCVHDHFAGTIVVDARMKFNE